MKHPHDTRKTSFPPAAVAAYALLASASAFAPGTARAAIDSRSPSDPGARPASDDSATRPRVGVIVGVGFPRPLAVEGLVKFDRFALGAEYGALPPVDISGVNVSMWSVAADARVFPLGGEFFIGLRAGVQHIDAQTAISLAQYGSVSEALELDSWFLNPRFGILWRSDVGLTLGIEAGVQFPLNPSTTSSLPLSLVPGAQTAVDSLGKAILPTVDLLRIGLLL
jgi:hypothetical protein